MREIWAPPFTNVNTRYEARWRSVGLGCSMLCCSSHSLASGAAAGANGVVAHAKAEYCPPYHISLVACSVKHNNNNNLEEDTNRQAA